MLQPGGVEAIRDSLKENWFVHANVRDSCVEVFADTFIGTRTLTYSVRAVTSGKFYVQAAKAEEMYKPDISGTSSSLSILVQ